jgi:hypothetical protein
MKLLIMQFSPFLRHVLPPGPDIPIINTLSPASEINLVGKQLQFTHIVKICIPEFLNFLLLPP